MIRNQKYKFLLTEAGINRIFDLFDDDRTGAINLNNIRRVAKELGETMNASELEEMLQRAATNGREISREDFYNIMTKRSIWFELILFVDMLRVLGEWLSDGVW